MSEVAEKIKVKLIQIFTDWHNEHVGQPLLHRLHSQVEKEVLAAIKELEFEKESEKVTRLHYANKSLELEQQIEAERARKRRKKEKQKK